MIERMDTTAGTAQLNLWREGTGSAGDWTLRESARSRRLSVRVHQGGRVEVVVPRGTARPMVLAFLQRHRRWIDQRREQAQRLARPAEPFPPSALRLAAIGEHWRLHLSGGSGSFRVAPSGRSESHVGPGSGERVLSIRGDGDSPALRACLLRWLYGHAQAELGSRLQRLASATGHQFARLQIRRQRSRWGSCSVRGTISLNCALLFQRPEVLNYLLIHELVHTRHMNHSRRYWAAVANLEPRYRELDRELLAGWTRVPAWLFAEPEELN
jgi:predicted metal-dependent hydrolase